MKRNLKYQTQQIVVPAATKGEELITVELDRYYDRVVGLYIPEQAGFAPSVRMGIRDPRVQYQQRTNIRDYVATTDVAHKDRFKAFNIPAKGNQLTFQVERTATIGAELAFDVVMLLEKEND